MVEIYQEIKQKLFKINQKKRVISLVTAFCFSSFPIVASFYSWTGSIPFWLLIGTLWYFALQKEQLEDSDIRKGYIFNFLYDKNKPLNYFYDTIYSLYLTNQAKHFKKSFNAEDKYIHEKNKQGLEIHEKITYNQQVLVKLSQMEGFKFESLPVMVQAKFNQNHFELIEILKTFLGDIIRNHELFDESSECNQIMQLMDDKKKLLINENLANIYQQRIKHQEEIKLAKEFEQSLNLSGDDKEVAKKSLSL
jgi:hypothetical protein